MRVVKHKRMVQSPGQCHNGCTSTQVGAKLSTHTAWILDTPTYLCGKCAKEWQGIWDGAR